MAIPIRKTHFLIALVASLIETLKRGLASTFAAADALTGTGYATAGQVVTTTQTFTALANAYAGCWLITATKAPCLIVSHPAVTGAALALTVVGAAPATTAEAFRILRGPTPGAPLSGGYHYDRTETERTITAPVASSLVTSRALLKATVVAVINHGQDTLAHSAIDGDLPEPSELPDVMREITGMALTGSDSLCSLANDIKGLLNGHYTDGVHVQSDGTNTIMSADATDQTSLNTLLNEIRTKFNLHMAGGNALPSWRLID